MSAFAFGFESLDVYQRSLEFLVLASQIAGSLPRGESAMGDQLRRAALSVPLNLAEGSGRTRRLDAARHRGSARGSAMECAAILDACWVLGHCEPQMIQQGRNLLVRVVAMLSRMRD